MNEENLSFKEPLISVHVHSSIVLFCLLCLSMFDLNSLNLFYFYIMLLQIQISVLEYEEDLNFKLFIETKIASCKLLRY